MSGLIAGIVDVLGVAVGIVAALVVIFFGTVFYFAFRKPKKKLEGERAAQAQALGERGRANIMEVRRLAMRIRDVQVRTLSDRICDEADKITRALKDHPENVAQVKQFFNYYLPTLASILSKYVRLEESGTAEENMAQKTVAFLTDIDSAMNRQYANLFEDDKLDLAVEMETLTLACKRDGLLVGEEFRLRDGDRDIVLTL